MRRFYIFILLLIISISAFSQSDWRKNGIKIPPPVCYGSGHSHQHFTPAPDQYQKRLKSTVGLKSTIEVEYVGFSNEAKAAFEKAVDIWESLIYSPVTIHMIAFWSSLDEGVLGSCGPSIYYENFEAATFKDCYYPIALVEKMQGQELTGSEYPDMIAQFNKDNDNWYFGTDGQTPVGKYDFVTIVLHEIGHGLGFTGFFYEQNGKGAYGDEFEFPGVFDEFVAKYNGNLLVDTSYFKNNTEELLDAFTGNVLVHLSESAKDSSESDSYPRLWAPNPFDEGSSIYHLNEFFYDNGDVNALMTPFADEGEAVHNPGPLTLGIFADIGWSFITIHHEEVADLEVASEPIHIQASVFSDQELDSTSVKLIYTLSDFEENSSEQLMAYEPSLEMFTTDLESLANGQIKYYLEAKDVNGKTYRMPGIAPEKYFDFNLGPDTIKPIILHNPIKSILESNLTTDLVVEANDNIGIDKVEIEYLVNGENGQTLVLTHDSINVYSTELSFSGLSDGDSISYRIKATDATSNSNSAYLPKEEYFVMYVDGTFEPIDEYFNNFNSFTRDFITTDFFVGTEPGFDDGALHSPHPYPSPDVDEMTFEFTAMLKYPITLKNRGVITFKEVVLVEPGEPNTEYGDDEFWDYVIIEGSRNGIDNWHPLIDGYDSRENPDWLQLYNGAIVGNNSNATGNKSLYVQKRFYLNENEFFNTGESIFVRFRVFSDPYAHGWGWAIDDISIQDPLTSSGTLDYFPDEITVFPNPLKSTLNIHARFTKSVDLLRVRLLNSSGFSVIDANIQVQGKVVEEKLDIEQLNAGLYLLVFSFDNGQTITKKLIKQ